MTFASILPLKPTVNFYAHTLGPTDRFFALCYLIKQKTLPVNNVSFWIFHISLINIQTEAAVSLGGLRQDHLHCPSVNLIDPKVTFISVQLIS